MAKKMTCRWCREPIEMVEPEATCGWAHVNLPTPDTMRYWCGTNEQGDWRRIEPWRLK